MICRTSATYSLLCVLASTSYFRFSQEIFIQSIWDEQRQSLHMQLIYWGSVCLHWKLKKMLATNHSLLFATLICFSTALLLRLMPPRVTSAGLTRSLVLYLTPHGTLFERLLGLRYYTLTCTSHTTQSWWPAPPRRCLCCPRRESPPSAWRAHPAGPAAFGRWTGSPHAAHTGPQAAADCHLQSGSMRMYRHIPRADTGTNKVMMERRKGVSLHSSGGRRYQARSWQKGYELLNTLQFVLPVLPVSAPQWLCG